MIDDHCHPFATEGGPLDLSGFSLDVADDAGAGDRRRALAPTLLTQELMRVKLADRFGCAPEDVEAARAEASADWPSYVSGLFADAELDNLVMDASYPPGATDNLGLYEKLCGCRIHPIFRIDPMLDEMIGAGAQPAGEIVERVQEAMASAAATGSIGFKTVMAYRTGLNVDSGVTIEEANRSLASAAGDARRRAKPLRDLVARAALATAADLGLPFQFHTGFGDSELRLAESNPLLLEELLRTAVGSAAKVVLIHGSYPWHEELAYLTATKPNVWADVSLSNIFAPATVADRLMRIVELAPAARVVLGTDGHGQPETFWFASLVLHEAWARCREALTAAGARRSWIDTVESLIFERNARELYGI